MLEKKISILRIVFIYMFFASLWVFLSDQVFGGLVSNQAVLTWIQANRGSGFVVVSGILIYFLLSLQTRTQPVVSQEGTRQRDQLLVQLGLENSGIARDFDRTLERLALGLELRNQESKNHCQRVTEMTLQLSRLLGVPEEGLGHIRRGAFLHDIGKMGIPDSILLKNGPLTQDERAVMEQHPLIAADLFSRIPYLEQAMEIPCSHHERWDGAGYPHGLKADEIPLAARIFAVVDVYDALTSDRPYRKALPHRAASTFIRSQSGTHFDPQVVEAFFKLEDTGHFHNGVAQAELAGSSI